MPQSILRVRRKPIELGLGKADNGIFPNSKKQHSDEKDAELILESLSRIADLAFSAIEDLIKNFGMYLRIISEQFDN